MTTSTIPTALHDALPADTDLSRCTITTYGELSDVDGAYSTPADDAVVVILPGWIADDGTCVMHIAEAESGNEAAQEYVDNGGWGEVETTSWITVRAWRVGYLIDADGDVVEVAIDRDSHTIALDPDEPKCAGDHDHEWLSPYSVLGGLEENPGVWGHGGGVIIKTICAHCGKYRVEDSVQGLDSIAYEDADEASRAWIDRRIADAAEDVPLPDGYTFHRGTEDRRPRLIRDEDEAAVRVHDYELREVVEQQSWDAIIEQFPETITRNTP